MNATASFRHRPRYRVWCRWADALVVEEDDRPRLVEAIEGEYTPVLRDGERQDVAVWLGPPSKRAERLCPSLGGRERQETERKENGQSKWVCHAITSEDDWVESACRELLRACNKTGTTTA